MTPIPDANKLLRLQGQLGELAGQYDCSNVEGYYSPFFAVGRLKDALEGTIEALSMLSANGLLPLWELSKCVSETGSLKLIRFELDWSQQTEARSRIGSTFPEGQYRQLYVDSLGKLVKEHSWRLGDWKIAVQFTRKAVVGEELERCVVQRQRVERKPYVEVALVCPVGEQSG